MTLKSRLKFGIVAAACIAVGASFAIPTPSAKHFSSDAQSRYSDDPQSPEAQLALISSGVAPEAQLANVFEQIDQNRLDVALQLVENLTREYPNFRLAQLIKGDLLLARSGPIRGFGNAVNAPADQIADLRDEAMVRLHAYRNKPQSDAIPRYLLQMQQDQKYAIIIDTSKSRLYLYQNDHGTPRFVTDYYVTQGKLGADKLREGDKKTPLGVYHVTASLPRQKLADLYGVGAFPINYPNDWDKRNGRSGSGIWLHGTPANTYARPPKASDGCVVLPNKDLIAVSRYLQIGLTPVIISHNVEWMSLDDWQAERTNLQKQIEEWRADWESMDVDRYLRHYSRNFVGDGQNIAQWSERKRSVAANKQWIKVGTENISMFRNPGKEDIVVVSFVQNYRSDNLSNVMKKRQYWQKENGRWRIISEGAA